MSMTAKENAAPTGIGNGAQTSYNTHAYITDLTALARKLGGEVVGRDAIVCPGPGHTDDDRSLSVKLDPTASFGFIFHSFAGDDWRACREHIMAAMGGMAFAEASPGPAKPAPMPPDPGYWRVTWGRCVSAQGTLAEQYLTRRKVKLPPADLRFHSSLKVGEGVFGPAMVGLYRDVLTGQPVGIHRTFLFPDGRRGEKKALGRSPNVRAIMFGDTDPGPTLAISEGIETALSIRAMGWADPIWAMSTAGGIERLPVLPGVKNLVIFGDRDGGPHFTGEGAASRCADRWRALGHNVEVRLPEDVGDWNDVLTGRIAR